MTEGTAISAGRFDASNAAHAARFARATHLASKYASTEFMHSHWKYVKKLRPGWGKVHRNEFFVAWDATMYKPWGLPGTRTRLRYVSGRAFNRGRIRIRAKVLEVKLQRVDNGHRGWLTCMHLPAHLQEGNGYTTDPAFADEVAAHRQAVSKLGRKASRRKDSHPDYWQEVVGDVNVDLFRASWRAAMSAGLHLSGMWRAGTLPDHGDMGPRLITGGWTYGLVHVHGKVLNLSDEEKGLDHDMVLMVHGE